MGVLAAGLTFWDLLHGMRYALIVGPLMAAACSLLSVFVVLRGMAMISEGIAHAGVGGLALALLISYFVPVLDNIPTQILMTGVFCVAAALLIGYFTRGGKVSEDSSIGIVLVATLALGILLLTIRQHLRGGYPPTLEQVLAGDIGSVQLPDVYVACGTAVVVFAVIFSMYDAFIYTALDEEMARVNGVPVRLINVLLLVLVSMTIVITVRLIGYILINALMVIPGATAKLMGRRFNLVVAASIAMGTGGMFLSLILAVALGACPAPFSAIPTGPIIALTLFFIFLVVWLLRQLVKPRVKGDEISIQNSESRI